MYNLCLYLAQNFQVRSLNFLYFVDEAMKDELAGTTAVTVLLKNNKLYCVSQV